MLRYTLLLLLLHVSAELTAQADTLFTPRLRLGVDVSGLAKYFMEPEVIQGEISADFEWKRDWFAAAEAGMTQIDILRESHAYKATGYFVRVGTDYNVLKKENQNHIGQVVLSARYGYGMLTQRAPEISISIPGWPSLMTGIDPETIHAHWFEIGGGIKTRLWKNIFLGWSLRTRFMIAQTQSPGMDPYLISGYGRNDGKNPVMVYYFIYYRL